VVVLCGVVCVFVFVVVVVVVVVVEVEEEEEDDDDDEQQQATADSPAMSMVNGTSKQKRKRKRQKAKPKTKKSAQPLAQQEDEDSSDELPISLLKPRIAQNPVSAAPASSSAVNVNGTVGMTAAPTVALETAPAGAAAAGAAAAAAGKRLKVSKNDWRHRYLGRYACSKQTFCRETAEISSKRIGKLRVGVEYEVCDVRKISDNDGVAKTRVLVQDADNEKLGWVNLISASGNELLRKLTTATRIRMVPPQAGVAKAATSTALASTGRCPSSAVDLSEVASASEEDTKLKEYESYLLKQQSANSRSLCTEGQSGGKQWVPMSSSSDDDKGSNDSSDGAELERTRQAHPLRASRR
jgi:hypothetical protein